MVPFAFRPCGSMTLTNSISFPSTPVVTGTNSGYIIAFADSGNGIKVCALQGSAGNYWYSDSIYTINCPSKNQPAMYPSIAWGTDNIPSNSWFEPTAHLVWQQHNSKYFNLISRAFGNICQIDLLDNGCMLSLHSLFDIFMRYSIYTTTEFSCINAR